MAETPSELFPPSPRVMYGKAPLVQVICQLRFPALLSIESQPPAAFQERIREIFPLLERVANPFPIEMPPELAQMIRAQSGQASYQFLTENRVSAVTLTPDSLALVTTKYTCWEEFRDLLRVPLSALLEIYKPSFFSRIGLRYQDAIDRGALGLSGEPWSKLLNREVLGELVLPQFEQNLEEIANRLLKIRLPNGLGSVLFRHGLGQVQGRQEPNYLFDFDFFNERKTNVKDAEPSLNYYNSIAGHAFRWCISDYLESALEPSNMDVLRK